MTAVLRVKRRNTESPSDSLMLSFLAKRQRLDITDDSNAYITPAETIAQFAGTLKDQTENVTQHLASVLSNVDTQEGKGTKRAIENENQQDTSKKVPRLGRLDSPKDRYKIISCHPLDVINGEEAEDKWTTLVDIEDCWSTRVTDQEATEIEQSIEQYVYDLYYAQTDVRLEQNDISVYEMALEPSWEQEESGDESDNENSESNPANNYPDTDPDRSEWEYDSHESVNRESDDELFGESETDKKFYGSSYRQYRYIVRNYDTDASSEREDSTDSDESFGI